MPPRLTTHVTRRRNRLGHAKRQHGLFSLIIALIAGFGPNCRPQPTAPEHTLRRFFADLESGKVKALWKYLSTENQRELLALHAQRRDERPSDPATLLAEDLELTVIGKPVNWQLIEQTEFEAQIAVSTEGGAPVTFRLVREAGVWKIDLLAALQPIETSSTS